MARGQGGFARWVLSPCLVPVLGGVSSIERYSDGAPDSKKGAHLNPRGRAPPPPAQLQLQLRELAREGEGLALMLALLGSPPPAAAPVSGHCQ